MTLKVYRFNNFLFLVRDYGLTVYTSIRNKNINSLSRFSEKLREYAFWIIDFFRGSAIRKHYRTHFETVKEQRNNANLQLNKLIEHVKQSVPYYQNKKITTLTDFPLVHKSLLKARPQDFVTTYKSYRPEHKIATSGSTGTSFVVFQDRNKKYRNIADILYYSKLAGFKIGYELYYLRFWGMFEKKSIFTAYLQRVKMIDVFDLNENTIKKLIDKMSKSSSYKGMIGYATSFGKICDYLESKGTERHNLNIKSIVGISERLENTIKSRVKRLLNVDMVSRYSNAENGMIAQQPLGEHYFVLNENSYIVEIFDLKKDEKLEDGKLGRIVVTDLYNFYSPFLRYDTGDIGILDTVERNGEKVKVLLSVEGRKMDMIKNTQGEILSTSILLLINKYDEILKRQIIQKTKDEYIFKLKTENNTFEKRNEFINEFKSYLGEDAKITITMVDDISALPSGKEQAIINEFNF